VDRTDLSDAASKVALSPDLVEAVAWQESRLRPQVVSPAGAIGEMQLMPGTARDLGVDPYDSRQNISGGAAYLSGLLKRYDGDMVRALAAYNAGPKAVDRYGGVPPYKETQDYVASILERLSRRAAIGPEQ
jgi:soluble lytic murein transglycosylase-like protein